MAQIFITSGRQVFAGSNAHVFGYSGTEHLYVLPGSTGVIFTQPVERVIFVGPLSDYSFRQTGNTVSIYTNNGTTRVADGSAQDTASGTNLTFTDGTVSAVLVSGIMEVGGIPISTSITAVTPTVVDINDNTGLYAQLNRSGATIFLDPGEQFPVGSNTIVEASNGEGSIRIIPTAGNIKFDQSIGRIIFPGRVSDYIFGQAGNTIRIFWVGSNGPTLVAWGPVQGDSDGTQLVFTDGMVNTTLAGGVMKVGGTTVTGTDTTPTPITPAVIDAGTVSGPPINILATSASLPTARLFLGVDEQVVVNSNTEVFGNTGVEGITVATGATNIIFDQNVEKVVLPGGINEYTFGSLDGEIYVYKGGVLVVRGVVQTDADGTQLIFSGGAVNVVTTGGTVTVGGTTLTGTPTAPTTVVPTTTNPSVTTGSVGTTTGTTRYLNVNEQAIIKSNVTVFGNTGIEVIQVEANATNITFNRTVEKIIFTGHMNEYTFGQSGNEVHVFKGGVRVVKGQVQDDADGTQLIFTNGAVDVKSVAGVMTVGGTTLTGTPTTPTPVAPTVINPSINTGTATTPITRTTLNLSVNDYVHVGSTTDVHGNTGIEGIVVIPGTVDSTFDRAIEEVTLSGKINEYTFGKNGDELHIFKGGVRVIKGLIQTDTDGTRLVFDDIKVDVTIVGGSMYIGGTIVSGDSVTPTPVVPTTGTPITPTTPTTTTGSVITAYARVYGGNAIAFDDDFGSKYPNMRITSIWGIH